MHLPSSVRTASQATPNHAAGGVSDLPNKPTPFDRDTYLVNAKNKLASQPIASIGDILSTTSSRLLTISLLDHCPSLFPPDHAVPPPTRPVTMPQGHHLVYYPLQLPPSQLMPDGTDPAHSPGAPFVRRMWAGGSVVFPDEGRAVMLLDGRSGLCTESVGAPLMRADQPEGKEKVFVEVTREYGVRAEFGEWFPAVLEVRRLVFMRERERGREAEGPPGKERRIVKMSATPEFTFPLKPDATLLFHFSALTYNAHAIHIDPDYARKREGYKGLLVHGPLTLVLMLEALRASLDQLLTTARAQQQYIKSIDYRNLAPLYVDEEMKVCLRRGKQEGGELKWDVWVEGPEGGLAVRASAVTADPNPPAEPPKAQDKETEEPKQT
ncbi:hypothetical protein BT67DRAFT_378158 [Trichocladium antarcticum]|uniref:Uncharacterized protein n=1 Tax=Trichocladium antarcticum TaxID=1450529 RepID=A0AAN6UPB9_9PEZI|nr:hypothetical protein BT67DRAFT_378158 [Trichocladium antarcticum]